MAKKAEKKTTTKKSEPLKSFFFPNEERSIKAKNLEEALKKLNS